MKRKLIIVMLLSITCILATLFIPSAQATTITSATFNRDIYQQGETGYITVTVYNDREEKIQVTELTATIDYYYSDENIYIQTFYSDEDLPLEIERGETNSLHLPFSLPTNIAPGYTEIYVRAKTELWHNQSEIWYSSENPTSRPVLYTESPYKQWFESQDAANDLLQNELQELQAINTTTTSLMYLFAVTTIAFVAVMILLIMLKGRPRAIPQPAA